MTKYALNRFWDGARIGLYDSMTEAELARQRFATRDNFYSHPVSVPDVPQESPGSAEAVILGAEHVKPATDPRDAQIRAFQAAARIILQTLGKDRRGAGLNALAAALAMSERGQE